MPTPINLDDVTRAADRLRAGGIVAFPTETVYGLGADALSPAAVNKVFALKGRPATNPLIVHVTGPEMALRVAASWPRRAELLADAFWPGPLTLVVPRRDDLPPAITAGGATVAVRSPDHPTAMALLFAFGGPLVGPSANKSGFISPTTAHHVRDAFLERDVLTLDGGPCSAGIESTVVLLTEPRVRILRPGLIGASDLAAVLREPVDLPGPAPSTAELLQSPGLLESHYAPSTQSFRFTARQAPSVAALARRARIAVIAHQELESLADLDSATLLPLPPLPRLYAARLYETLREADARGLEAIFILMPDTNDPNDPNPPASPTSAPASTADAHIWAAIADRLTRATRPFLAP